jgi:hypothetical protein
MSLFLTRWEWLQRRKAAVEGLEKKSWEQGIDE